MTYVSITENKIELYGHANAGKYGQDIVCSAISILATSLAQFVSNMDDENELKEYEVILKEGNVEITAEPFDEFRDKWLSALEYFETGIRLIQKHYPEYLMLKVGILDS